MNIPFPAAPPATPRTSWPRRFVNFLVALVVIAVAATAFFLSYPGVHAIALQGGVSVRLSRFYPGLFDAVLVIACVAAVMLRDGRWWARYWAWLVIIVVLAAIGATDAVHAMSYALPQRRLEGAVAVAPALAVLLAFSLLITLMRSSRPQPAGAAPSRRAARRAAEQQPAVVAVDASSVPAAVAVGAGATPRPPAPPIALPAATVPLPTPSPTMPSPTVPSPDAPSPATPSPATPLTAMPLPEKRSATMPSPAEPSSTVSSPTDLSPAAPSPVLLEAATPVTVPTEAPKPVSAPEEPAVAEATAAAAPSVPTTPVVPTIPQIARTTRAMSVTPATGLPKLTEDAVGPATATGPAPATEVPKSTQPRDPAPFTGTASETHATEGDATAPAVVADASGDGPGNTAVVPVIRPTEPVDTETGPAKASPAAKAEAANRASWRGPSSWPGQASGQDYWDADDDPRLAGQVYPVQTADAAAGPPADRASDGDGDGSVTQPHPLPPELDDDAPPFATAPFAPVPRLNRVRATPTPPVDSDKDEDN